MADVVIADRKEALTLGRNGSNPLFYSCPLDSLYIGGKITYSTSSSYGYSPFYRNTSLRTVVISDEETEIYANEFYGCTGLKNVKIGDGVKKIGDYAFVGCSNLEKIFLGIGLEEVGSYAFWSCSSLTSIYSSASIPPVCKSNALLDINKQECLLYVPKENIADYQTADQWKDFFHILDNDEYCENYILSYVVDGEPYHNDTIKEGAIITPIAEPTKEGYTFSGWSEIPVTMPAHDVVVTGSFSINSYALKYMVDGVVYKTDSVQYGATITPETEPIKTGYSFSGWSEIPETMPAHDVEVTGSFTINSYTLTYKVDGEFYKTDSVQYGETITPEAAPAKEGYTFSGWSEIPETMPAHDVEVTGSFTINTYKIELAVGEGGSATVSNEAPKYGSSVVLTITPSEGYKLANVVMNDKDVTASVENGSYTISNIVADVKISVTFSANVGIETITTEASDNVTIDLYGRKIQNTLNGRIYIQNGKKLIVK